MSRTPTTPDPGRGLGSANPDDPEPRPGFSLSAPRPRPRNPACLPCWPRAHGQRMAEASGKCLNCSTLQHRQHPQTNSQAHLNIASSISPPPPLPTHPPLTTPTTIHHNYKDDENSHIQALHPDRSGACLRDKCSKQTSSTLDSAIPSCSSSPCIQAQQRKQASPWHPQANMASVCRAPC